MRTLSAASVKANHQEPSKLRVQELEMPSKPSLASPEFCYSERKAKWTHIEEQPLQKCPPPCCLPTPYAMGDGCEPTYGMKLLDHSREVSVRCDCIGLSVTRVQEVGNRNKRHPRIQSYSSIKS